MAPKSRNLLAPFFPILLSDDVFRYYLKFKMDIHDLDGDFYCWWFWRWRELLGKQLSPNHQSITLWASWPVCLREHLNSDNQDNNDPPLFWYLNIWAFSRLRQICLKKHLAIIYLWYGLVLDLNCILYWIVYLQASIGLSINLWVLLCDDLLDLNFQRLNRSAVDIWVIYICICTCNHLALYVN